MSVYVGNCDLGKGVFAGKQFNAGDPIAAIGGPIIDYEATTRMGCREANPIQIGQNCYVDVEGIGLYLNHSCNPNAAIIRGTLLVALRSIQPNEEIRFDYSTTMANDSWTMECRCGHVECRQLIAEFPALPAHIRRRYATLGIVPRYVRQAAVIV